MPFKSKGKATWKESEPTVTVIGIDTSGNTVTETFSGRSKNSYKEIKGLYINV